ncbi:MAG: UvrD-helicase domain-containing protein [Cyclobacteriaceae bacterium]
MNSQNFHIYQSSAGSGKTYTLTREYLKLVLKQPDYFRSVLAVTFTNRATEEMKTRIVDTLHSLAKGEHNTLTDELMKELGQSQEQIQEKADVVLKNILHNYSSFAVITIDAFFQKVVRSFAREVGVQGSFEVELNQKKVISEVVDRMMMEIGSNAALTNWLTEFAFYKINDGKSWDTRRDINGLAQELFNELLVQEKESIFSKMEDESFLPSFMEEVATVVASFEQSLSKLADSAIELLRQLDLLPTDLAYGMTGVGGYLLRLTQDSYSAPSKRALNVLNEGAWYSKSSNKKELIDTAVDSGLHEMLEEIVTIWDKEGTRYFTAQQIVKNIYTFGLLSEVSSQLNQYREENDLLLISDFPIFLNHIIRDSDTPYIYEKIGSRFKHYLIDEFQDTSGLQWQNFKPLVKDAIDAGEFSMVVGDIKQSIYRWRGGNWKLLLEQIKQDIGDDRSINIPLNFNWRSKKNVIDFNNDFFKNAPDIIQQSFLREATEDISEMGNIKKAYEGVHQELVERDGISGGVVDFRFFEKEEYDDVNEAILIRLISELEALQDANYDLRDIAILIRNKHEGRLITEALMEHEKSNPNSGYKYDIISNESLFLKNSPVVNFLLCAFKVLQNPGEPLYKYELQYAWYVYLRGEGLFKEQDKDPILIKFEDQRENLNQLALVDMVEHICSLFGLADYKSQVAYLLAFQDAVLDFQKKENTGVLGYLDWWEENNDRAIQISDDMDAIRLMTIHKSKGLQFKVVMVPFCNWRLGHSPLHENIVWCHAEGQEPFSRLPYLPLRYKKDMNSSLFAKEYWEEKVRAAVDNLNLLYVALTRAEEALYVMAEIDEKKFRSLTRVNELLYSFFMDEQSERYALTDNHFRVGEHTEYSIYEKESHEEFSLDQVFSQPWQLRTELSVKSQRNIRNEDVLEKINDGIVVHDILSSVRMRADFEKAIKGAEVDYGLDEEKMASIKKKLRAFFELPMVNDWFSDKWDVKNESAIITENGEIRRPDRVMIKDGEAVVLDFKTGEVNDKNAKQVLEYKQYLSAMGYKKVKAYLLYIGQPKVIEVE